MVATIPGENVVAVAVAVAVAQRKQSDTCLMVVLVYVRQRRKNVNWDGSHLLKVDVPTVEYRWQYEPMKFCLQYGCYFMLNLSCVGIARCNQQGNRIIPPRRVTPSTFFCM